MHIGLSESGLLDLLDCQTQPVLGSQAQPCCHSTTAFGIQVTLYKAHFRFITCLLMSTFLIGGSLRACAHHIYPTKHTHAHVHKNSLSYVSCTSKDITFFVLKSCVIVTSCGLALDWFTEQST